MQVTQPPAFIILDGPDAVGKTVYAQTIQKLFPNSRYEHLTYIKDNQEMYRANHRVLLQAEASLRAGRTFILDRGWMSENIYSRVYRKGSGLAYEVRGLDRVIRRLGGVYVMACPDPKSAVDRHAVSCRNREEMYLPGPEIEQLAKLYCDLYYGTRTYDGPVHQDYVESIIAQGGLYDRPDVALYDIDFHGPHVTQHALMSFQRSVSLRERQWQEAKFDLHDHNLLGHYEFASHVIVGDQSCAAWPFAALSATNRAVSKAMHDAAVDELDYIWVNANDTDGIERLTKLSQAKPMSFISLGRRAAKTLDQIGVAYKDVYHPSFVGKFGHAPQDLINALR
jgi:hypothetical protein